MKEKKQILVQISHSSVGNYSNIARRFGIKLVIVKMTFYMLSVLQKQQQQQQESKWERNS